MLRVDRRLLQNVDWALLSTAIFVIALSILSMWTLAPGRVGASLVSRQLSWVAIGLVAMTTSRRVARRDRIGAGGELPLPS